MIMSNSILIVYDYFFPGYRAGGPIQSLTNLIVTLQNHYDISVFTSAFDLDQNEAYDTVAINEWNKILLQGVNKAINVFYASKNIRKSEVIELIASKNFSIIYLNGIFSSTYFLQILFAQKSIKGKIVVCPRGMLQKGALSVKPFKKIVYLKYLQLSRKLEKVFFHATNEEEKNDIVSFFSINKGVFIAPNIPKIPIENIQLPEKKGDELRFVFLSLITEKKNLLFLLQTLIRSNPKITLDIYGPIKDKEYWEECKKIIKKIPERVFYKGEVLPQNVQNVLAQYHAFILLTKGENFGHAIYESLSVGRPVITSLFTPWQDLENKNAGINADISDALFCIDAIEKFRLMDQKNYNQFCMGSYQSAIEYYKKTNAQQKYVEMFSSYIN